VLVFPLGFGIVANLSPFLKISKLLTSALAKTRAGHSSVTLVCVTCLSFSSGAAGESRPYSWRMESCRDQKSLSWAFSAARLRLTEMLTIEPEVTPGGRRREGNSIRWARSPIKICRKSKGGRCKGGLEFFALVILGLQPSRHLSGRNYISSIFCQAIKAGCTHLVYRR
jgi:hypothetical protein